MRTQIISSEKVSDEYLEVNSCSEEVLYYIDYHTKREKGRIDFGLQYVAEGRCYYEDDGEEKVIEKGFALLQFPNVRQHYYFKKDDKTTLVWCHFSGQLCKMLERFNTGKTVAVDLTKSNQFEYIFRHMISTFNVKDPYYKISAAGYMAVIISEITKSLECKDINMSNLTNHDIDMVINHMYFNYNKPIELNNYAGMCCLSKSRFTHLFKQYTGVSPYHFQLNIRIERAIDILSTTESNVKDCATAVGFDDLSYFCRIFKKFTSKSPTEYKKNRLKNN